MRLLMLGILFVANVVMADVAAIPARAGSPAPPRSVWGQGDAGALEHLQSGPRCPPRIAGYRRMRASVYDAFGLDVGCSYTSAKAVVTLYFTQRGGGDLAGAMEGARRALLQSGVARHPRAVSEVPSAPAATEWTTAVYAEDGGLRSSIWMKDVNGWTLEYRATYAASDEAAVAAELTTISAAVATSAGARLALCARSAAPHRAASAISDRSELEQSALMTSLVGGGALALAMAGKAKPGPPTIWCVEASIVKAADHLLFWRGVDPDGADANTDRMTLASDGPPPTLVLAPDSLAGVVSDAAEAGDKKARWVATLPSDKRVLIFGYFDGRPAPEAVSDLFVNILSGTAKPVGSFGAQGRAIIVTGPPGS